MYDAGAVNGDTYSRMEKSRAIVFNRSNGLEVVPVDDVYTIRSVMYVSPLQYGRCNVTDGKNCRVETYPMASNGNVFNQTMRSGVLFWTDSEVSYKKTLTPVSFRLCR